MQTNWDENVYYLQTHKNVLPISNKNEPFPGINQSDMIITIPVQLLDHKNM